MTMSQRIGQVPGPDPFLSQPHPHTPTVIDPDTAAHYQHRLAKRELKILRAHQRQVQYQEKMVAKAAKAEARREERQRKEDEKERARCEKRAGQLTKLMAKEKAKVEHDHRHADENIDREERGRMGKEWKVMKEAAEARIREKVPKVVQNGDTHKTSLSPMREQRPRAGHIVPTRVQHNSDLESTQSLNRRDHTQHQTQIPGTSSESATLNGGVSWGFDPSIPDGGIEIGGTGKTWQAGSAHGLGLKNRHWKEARMQ